MARRKIVFVIVEGPSDDEALGVLLNQIYDKNTVYIHITHGDVTTKKGANSSTILVRLGEIVKTYMHSYHLNKLHFQEIIHIVDMDGAYIPDEAIVKDETASRPSYSLTEIHTANVQGIINRNAIKRSWINRFPQHQDFAIFRIRRITCLVIWIMCCMESSTPLMKKKKSIHCALQGSIIQISQLL